jgi:hypothetical protein
MATPAAHLHVDLRLFARHFFGSRDRTPMRLRARSSMADGLATGDSSHAQRYAHAPVALWLRNRPDQFTPHREGPLRPDSLPLPLRRSAPRSRHHHTLPPIASQELTKPSVQALQLCLRAGLVKRGNVVTEGTKRKANAAWGRGGCAGVGLRCSCRNFRAVKSGALIGANVRCGYVPGTARNG